MGVLDPIDFIFDTFGPLGGLLVVKKDLIGGRFEGERVIPRVFPC